MNIEITPPKFDLHGFYHDKVRRILQTVQSRESSAEQIKALINQAYQQGLHDARILRKDNSKQIEKELYGE